MSKPDGYTGNIEVIDGLTPANDQDFPLMHAHHILVDAKGTRLDAKLETTIQAVTTATEMDAILAGATDADVGAFYMYLGATTSTYKNGAVYRIGVK